MERYEDSTAHLIDELARVDCLLRRYLETWQATGRGDENVSGLYISDTEVDRILSPNQTTRASQGHAETQHVEMRREIDERAAATLRAGTDLRLRMVADRFGLTPQHVDALLLNIAPEFDTDYEKVYAYLQDDLTRKRPTVGLVMRVMSSNDRERIDARRLLSDASPLVKYGLVRLRSPEQGAPLLAHRVTVDQRVVSFLLGADEIDSKIADCTEMVVPETSIEELPLDEETRAAVAGLVPDSDSSPVMQYVYGPYGVGKNAAIEALCTGLDRPLVRADAARLARGDPGDSLDRLRREARLRDAVLYLRNVDRLDEGEGDAAAERLARDLDRFEDHVFLSGESEWRPPRDLDAHAVTALHLPRPGYERRKELWDRRADDLPADLDTADLAATFSLTRGQIDDTIADARLRNGSEVTNEAVYSGCRTQSRETLGTLARRTEPTYTWDDIVLPADELQQLREVAAHVAHRGTVYADWGFANRFSLGNGLNVLFSGPSGTGKTMAAEIIADEAGLDLFKIDLANVVSKYIGETEERLKQIFDEAEHSDAILFFDEADALFGERSEVSDSHDRYANIEVSYLLQRMEEHDGTVVLTSNLEENIDDAFLRRINLHVTFPRPDYGARAAIWGPVFPEATPVGDLDYRFLASFEITGGNIKNVALTAAFLAAEDGGAVEMAHVVHALRRELQKAGRMVSPEDFGEYAGLLE
jgi:ATP-dependent 26S proteasome regulatory subunit